MSRSLILSVFVLVLVGCAQTGNTGKSAPDLQLEHAFHSDLDGVPRDLSNLGPGPQTIGFDAHVAAWYFAGDGSQQQASWSPELQKYYADAVRGWRLEDQTPLPVSTVLSPTEKPDVVHVTVSFGLEAATTAIIQVPITMPSSAEHFRVTPNTSGPHFLVRSAASCPRFVRSLVNKNGAPNWEFEFSEALKPDADLGWDLSAALPEEAGGGVVKQASAGVGKSARTIVAPMGKAFAGLKATKIFAALPASAGVAAEFATALSCVPQKGEIAVGELDWQGVPGGIWSPGFDTMMKKVIDSHPAK